MFCRNCGNRINDNAVACPICKTPTDKTVGASQEFRTYSPLWASQQEQNIPVQQPPVQQPPVNNIMQKQDGKKNKIIIASVAVAAVVIVAAVVLILLLG